MTTPEILIGRLAAEAAPARRCPHPAAMFAVWLLLTLAATLLTGCFMGLRPDLAVQLRQPLFMAEILALFSLVISTVVAAIWLAFPDQRQQTWVTRLPAVPFALYAALLIYRAVTPGATLPPLEPDNGIHCSLCITMCALAPAALLFQQLRRCATVFPRRAGTLALLAASAIGHLLLKFVEANDGVSHFAVSHLLPILLLGWAGGWLGKKFLAW